MGIEFRSVGLDIRFDSTSTRWLSVVREACAGQEQSGRGAVDVHVTVREGGRPDLGPLQPLTRGAWTAGSRVILDDACGSGLDLAVDAAGDALDVTAWPHPSWRHRGLGVVAPDRQVLLHRAALLQYPALWWAGVRGLVPMHASAARVSGQRIVLAGPGGVGKSTLLSKLDGMVDVPASDNLCAVEGSTVHGLLEPARGAAGPGRRMPHGRRESPWPSRLESLETQHLLVLRRGTGNRATVREIDAEAAARELTAGTYAAGELRRYWAFAATLALGTGLGPAHPPVEQAAIDLARRVRCSVVVLPATPSVTLSQIVGQLPGTLGHGVRPASSVLGGGV